MTPRPFDVRLRLAREASARLTEAVGQVIVGQKDVVEQTLWGLLAGGHVLLEGAPGLGKTLLVRTLAACLDLRFSRIQFTPDLMPSDVLGTNMLVNAEDGSRRFVLHRGPIFGQMILADEINRARPQRPIIVRLLAWLVSTLLATLGALLVRSTEPPPDDPRRRQGARAGWVKQKPQVGDRRTLTSAGGGGHSGKPEGGVTTSPPSIRCKRRTHEPGRSSRSRD